MASENKQKKTSVYRHSLFFKLFFVNQPKHGKTGYKTCSSKLVWTSPLQKKAKKSPEFRGKIPGFPRFFAHKEKPGKPGVSWLSRKARRLLAPRDSALSGLSKYPLSPGKPGMLLPKAWGSLESQEEMLRAFLAFPYVQKARKARNDSQLSRIPQFLGKHGIPTRKACMEKREKPSYIQLLVLSLRILSKLNIEYRTHHLQSLKIVAWCLRTHYFVSVTVVHHPKEIRQIS